MRKLLLGATALAALGLLVGQPFSTEARASEGVTWENSDLHTVSLMLSEPMLKVDGGYHELLDGRYLKPIQTENKTVMAPLDDIFDELNGTVQSDGEKKLRLVSTARQFP